MSTERSPEPFPNRDDFLEPSHHSDSSAALTCSAKLCLDRLILAGGWGQLAERELEHVVAFLPTPVASVREAEVGDDLRLVLLVTELAERRCGFLEQTDCPVVVAGMTQRESQVALGQCDSLPVVERSEDLQCATMAVHGVVVQPVAAILVSGSVESK